MSVTGYCANMSTCLLYTSILCQKVQHFCIHIDDFAHISNICLLSVNFGIALPAFDQFPINSRNTKTFTALCSKKGNNFFIRFPNQNHLRHPHCFLIGYPQAIDKFTFNIKLLQSRRNVRTAAVDNNGIETNVFEQCNICLLYTSCHRSRRRQRLRPPAP